LAREQICLIGAKDAHHAPYAELALVPTPDIAPSKTRDVSYMPVAYADIADATRAIFAELFGPPTSECYALARGGQQFYGRQVFPWGDTKGLQVALRGSHDQSIANQAALGLSTFVCANGMMSGEHMISLKHTTNVRERLPAMLHAVAGRAQGAARALEGRQGRWDDVTMGDDLFFAYVGILVGRGIITPTKANAALRYWRACRDGDLHSVHGDPNLGNAFQAVSGAMHTGHPARVFQDFAGIDAITEGVARSGGALDGIPAFSLEMEQF